MKKILILLISLISFSCSSSDDSLESYPDPMPVESVDLPNEFISGETYNINITYLRPTTCHAFNDIIYQKNDNERIIHVFGTYFLSNGNCTELNAELEASFSFKETLAGTYILKFWQGEDDNGEDIYLTEEITVVD